MSCRSTAVRARRGRRPTFRACALTVAVVGWAAASGAARADEVILQSGERIEGTIVDATRNTVVVRRAIGGMRQMRIRDIEEVRIDLAQGQSIAGRILSWVDGVHRIRVGDEVVSVRAGLVLSRAPYEKPAGQPPGPAPPGSGQQPTREAGEVAAAAAEKAAADREAAEKAAAEKAAAEKRTAERAASPDANERPEAVAVKGSVGPAEGGVAGLVFRIELSRPADRTVVLIYGTVDGTAKAGKDYEPRQGIITLAPGDTNADVYVPLKEGLSRKDDARFELFLTADPEVAEVVDQRITAVIPGDG